MPEAIRVPDNKESNKKFRVGRKTKTFHEGALKLNSNSSNVSY